MKGRYVYGGCCVGNKNDLWNPVFAREGGVHLLEYLATSGLDGVKKAGAAPHNPAKTDRGAIACIAHWKTHERKSVTSGKVT